MKKFWVLGRGSRKKQKTSFLKTDISSPLKTDILRPLKIDFSCISQVSDSRDTRNWVVKLYACFWSNWNFFIFIFRVRLKSQSTRRWVMKLSAWFFKRTKFSHFISRLGWDCIHSRNELQNCQTLSFSTQKFWLFEKNIQSKSEKKNQFQKKIMIGQKRINPLWQIN